MAETPLVHARRLRVGYSTEPVCAPVDLRLRPGEVLALIGPNGAGKSTVLRAVLGLLAPLDGELSVLGGEVDERSADFRARVAGVLDDDAWFPGLTTREHLLLTAAGHGVANTTTTVDAMLETFGLTTQQHVLPSALSSGQRRRLLLVLDEPEQRLDTAMRNTLAALLQAEADAGTAVLLATHDPLLVTALGADAVVVDDVRCHRVGSAEAVAAMNA